MVLAQENFRDFWSQFDSNENAWQLHKFTKGPEPLQECCTLVDLGEQPTLYISKLHAKLAKITLTV